MEPLHTFDADWLCNSVDIDLKLDVETSAFNDYEYSDAIINKLHICRKSAGRQKCNI